MSLQERGAPCYYCDGTGYAGDRQVDVDRWEPSGEACCECDGSGIASRVAGARNTGPKPLVYSYGRAYSGDPLAIMAACRAGWIKAKRAGDWTAAGRKSEYEYFRLVAMRPSSRARLAQADMLAMAARCVNRADEMRAAA